MLVVAGLVDALVTGLVMVGVLFVAVALLAVVFPRGR